MPKIKTICRSEESCSRETRTQRTNLHRNPDPSLHPFEKAREYTRALNAVKLDKIFAKPFLAALSGHKDSVLCLSTHPTRLGALISGSADGEIRIWNVSSCSKSTSFASFSTDSTSSSMANACQVIKNAHKGFVRSLSVFDGGDHFVSCGDDKSVHMWSPAPVDSFSTSTPQNSVSLAPTTSFHGPTALLSISTQHTTDSKRPSKLFATAGTAVAVWDVHRSEPLHNFTWGPDPYTFVRFSPVEAPLMASLCVDRSVCLYDLRGGSALQKVVMQMRPNCLAWNPREAMNFTVGSEDTHLYTFDLRKLSGAATVHKDHVAAVLDVDYSPTGREFATASYDRTTRIFPFNSGRSREVYHTKRMQRLFACQFSKDGRYIFTGSDDTNIRVWKAEASDPVKPLHRAAREKIKYNKALKEKFKHLPELRRIDRHRHLPKVIKKITTKKREMKEAAQRRESNALAHSGGDVKFASKAERKKHIVEVVS